DEGERGAGSLGGARARGKAPVLARGAAPAFFPLPRTAMTTAELPVAPPRAPSARIAHVPEDAPRWLVLTAFGLVYVLWGSTYLGIRIAIETIPPFLMAGVRFLIAGVILYAFARGRGAPRPERAHWRSAFVVGA